ncbi:hypothetical protein STSP_65160 [Streptomyces jeddahensis]|uniref:Uncharacterized protein n=1 Tax=Streptomyces jeddahensis TaxID=1716141 RepID=A0A177HI26_9ACTN|nr:hypothetical protein STSP_65160 [Streptomyces jeddahensis]
MEAIAEAAARGDIDLGLVSVDSTVARAHHHAAGMVVDVELLDELEKAVVEEKGLQRGGKTTRQARRPTSRQKPSGNGAVPRVGATVHDCGPQNWAGLGAG